VRPGNEERDAAVMEAPHKNPGMKDGVFDTR
jgi:hypothetical protein